MWWNKKKPIVEKEIEEPPYVPSYEKCEICEKELRYMDASTPELKHRLIEFFKKKNSSAWFIDLEFYSRPYADRRMCEACLDKELGRNIDLYKKGELVTPTGLMPIMNNVSLEPGFAYEVVEFEANIKRKFYDRIGMMSVKVPGITGLVFRVEVYEHSFKRKEEIQ